MSSFWPLAVINFPILCGLFIIFVPFKKRRTALTLVETFVAVTAVLTWILILNPPAEDFVLFQFVGKYTIRFHVDGLSKVFSGLISCLWPLATLYAFEYMEHEASDKTLKEKTFFGVYTITYGVTLGISFSANLLTMYLFYEMLTLVTIPLVLFTLTRDAIRATRSYMVFSLGGAAFAFISLIFLMSYGDTIRFTYGGVLNMSLVGDRVSLIRLVYIMGFMGFGVKAAVFPLNSWLPKASVAPTPVTALLHAVAVVKSGAFAIIRLTYYCYGTGILKGTLAQYLPMAVASFTIVYGCARALKERHVKRRLAYSTTSNLSYILFAALLMTPMGMKAALAFMVFHGFMKITAFFCAGAYLTRGGISYVYELDGVGKSMPRTSIIFALAALSIVGIPGLPGFAGKWLIAEAAIDSGTVMAMVGIVAIMISALLTAAYMLQMVLRIFFHKPAETEESGEAPVDPGPCMLVPLYALSAFLIVLGTCFAPMVEFIRKVSEGVM